MASVVGEIVGLHVVNREDVPGSDGGLGVAVVMLVLAVTSMASVISLHGRVQLVPVFEPRDGRLGFSVDGASQLGVVALAHRHQTLLNLHFRLIWNAMQMFNQEA